MPNQLFGKITIIVLGGAIKKTSKGWRTTNFNDKGDLFGVCGDRLRILAVSIIYNILNNCNKEVSVVVSGGRGQYFGIIEGSPLLSKILKKELIEIGVPSNLIIEEGSSNNTYEQLKKSSKILKKIKTETAIIISNRYHLPRIKAFIEDDNKLKKAFGENLVLGSAEDILIASNPEKWRAFVSRAYNSKDVKKRIILEKEGVKRIKSGNYFFKKYK